MENGLEAEDSGVDVPLTMQSRGIETQVDPPKRRNPRWGKQSDTTLVIDYTPLDMTQKA
jgi:hypothetical protein